MESDCVFKHGLFFFSVLKKCNRKLDCLIHEMLVHKAKEKAMLVHTQTVLHTRKTIYLNLSLFHTHSLCLMALHGIY